jgi:hypothetical protein
MASTPLPIDRVTAIALDPGAHVVVGGLVRTSVDGSVFTVPDLFDLQAGGLQVVGPSSEAQFTLAPTGEVGGGCALAGVQSPCLVPRIAQLAHARLKTQGELASTLTGSVEIVGVVPPPPAPPITPKIVGVLEVVAAIAALLVVFAAVRRFVAARARSALGRVRAAAREAMRATTGDATLDGLHNQVRAMLARANSLDEARQACAHKLAQIDRRALERRREACARSQSPDAAEALTWVTAECAEAARLESDLASSVVGLERIESALRVVTLRTREHRGTRARVAKGDPVDAVALELELRDEALDEVQRAVGGADPRDGASVTTAR